MDKHVQVVGVLSLVWAALVGLGFLVVLGLAFFVPMASTDAELLRIQWVLGAIVVLLLALIVLGVLAGIGLLRRRAWAKPLGFIVAVLALPSLPLGTAFGVYAIWVLTRPGIDEALGQR